MADETPAPSDVDLRPVLETNDAVGPGDDPVSAAEERPLSPAEDVPRSESDPAASGAEPSGVDETVQETPSGPDPRVVDGESPLNVATLPILALEEDAVLEQRVRDADPDAGWRYAQRCAACHSLAVEGPGPGGAQFGPPLASVFGEAIGAIDEFVYSPVFAALSETDAVWNATRLDAFLAAPNEAVPGTMMAFSGISDPGDRANVIAFLVELAAMRTIAEEVTGTADIADLVAAADEDRGALIAARSCGGCHQFADTEGVFVGPDLFDVVGREVGAKADFTYSPAMNALNTEGAIWTYAFLDAFLADPASAVPGTRMGMTGVQNAGDRAAIIAYLRQLSPDPEPLDVAIGMPVPGLTAVAFSESQANQGEAFYEVFGCGNCHGQDLRGDIDIGGFGDAPPLIGPSFQRRWFGQSLYSLFVFLREEKPPDSGDEMDMTAIVALVALILSENGFQAGAEPLPGDRLLLEATGFFQ